MPTPSWAFLVFLLLREFVGRAMGTIAFKSRAIALLLLTGVFCSTPPMIEPSDNLTINYRYNPLFSMEYAISYAIPYSFLYSHCYALAQVFYQYSHIRNQHKQLSLQLFIFNGVRDFVRYSVLFFVRSGTRFC